MILNFLVSSQIPPQACLQATSLQLWKSIQLIQMRMITVWLVVKSSRKTLPVTVYVRSDSSDFSRKDDFGSQSTEGFSDVSSGLSHSEEGVINVSAVSSELTNHEESVVDMESGHDLPDDELDSNGPSTLLLFEGSSKKALITLAGYFYWFSSHPSITKSALSSLLSHEHFNVLPPGNNLPSTYEQAVSFIKPQLLPTECYHACLNDCVLFGKTNRYDYSKLESWKIAPNVTKTALLLMHSL